MQGVSIGNELQSDQSGSGKRDVSNVNALVKFLWQMTHAMDANDLISGPTMAQG